MKEYRTTLRLVKEFCMDIVFAQAKKKLIESSSISIELITFDKMKQKKIHSLQYEFHFIKSCIFTKQEKNN